VRALAIALASAASIAFVATPASSAVLVQKYSTYTLYGLDWFRGIERFDGSLGTLNSVKVEWNSLFSEGIIAEYYDDESGQSVPYEVDIDLIATRSLSFFENQVFNLDFTMPVTVVGDGSWWLNGYSLSRSTAATFTGSQVDFFLGDENLVPTVGETYRSKIVAERIPAGAVGYARLDDGGFYETLTITYTYSTAVPEPASWALMLGGFGAIGTAMRRRRPVVA
jgi:hypothetical protein